MGILYSYATKSKVVHLLRFVTLQRVDIMDHIVLYQLSIDHANCAFGKGFALFHSITIKVEKVVGHNGTTYITNTTLHLHLPWESTLFLGIV